MIAFVRGNLLEAPAEALVNTVNTVGVMGKGIALMFKDAFPENTRAYEAACKAGEVEVGRMFVTTRQQLIGPKWIINFPTKRHWRNPSQLEWVRHGLADLVRVIQENGIRSVAVPPLGSGNGGLDWAAVRPEIERALGDLANVEVTVYEPTATYQNVSKRTGIEALTPARAMVAELVRQYGLLGFDCTLLEIQKLAYFAERALLRSGHPQGLALQFKAHCYGPFAPRLLHLIDRLDGSYLHGDRRVGDSGPLDTIWFDRGKQDIVAAYLASEGKAVRPALNAALRLIDGFETPFGMELLATVDWLVEHGAARDAAGIRRGLATWDGGEGSGPRKLRLFDDRAVRIALDRLDSWTTPGDGHAQPLQAPLSTPPPVH